jgi:hypothetical protein
VSNFNETKLPEINSQGINVNTRYLLIPAIDISQHTPSTTGTDEYSRLKPFSFMAVKLIKVRTK